jgi:hypothetical protein
MPRRIAMMRHSSPGLIVSSFAALLSNLNAADAIDRVTPQRDRFAGVDRPPQADFSRSSGSPPTATAPGHSRPRGVAAARRRMDSTSHDRVQAALRSALAVRSSTHRESAGMGRAPRWPGNGNGGGPTLEPVRCPARASL